jgi:hypothetical protein
MSLKLTLYEEIKSRGRISIDEMYKICDREKRKHDNGTRRLRDLMKANLIDKIVDEDRAIIAYVVKKKEIQPIYQKEDKKTVVGKKQAILDDLNDKLDYIKENIPPCWNNYHKLEEITNARKSKNEYLKEQIIDKYEEL